MIHELLKGFADDNNAKYLYGDLGTLNLIDPEAHNLSAGDLVILLQPITIINNYDDHGNVLQSKEQATFFIGYNSDFDGGTSNGNIEPESYYQEKYNAYISTAKNQFNSITALMCSAGISPISAKIIEVINLLDANLDGVFVTIEITNE